MVDVMEEHLKFTRIMREHADVRLPRVLGLVEPLMSIPAHLSLHSLHNLHNSQSPHTAGNSTP